MYEAIFIFNPSSLCEILFCFCKSALVLKNIPQFAHLQICIDDLCDATVFNICTWYVCHIRVYIIMITTIGMILSTFCVCGRVEIGE